MQFAFQIYAQRIVVRSFRRRAFSSGGFWNATVFCGHGTARSSTNQRIRRWRVYIPVADQTSSSCSALRSLRIPDPAGEESFWLSFPSRGDAVYASWSVASQCPPPHDSSFIWLSAVFTANRRKCGAALGRKDGKGRVAHNPLRTSREVQTRRKTVEIWPLKGQRSRSGRAVLRTLRFNLFAAQQSPIQCAAVEQHLFESRIHNRLRQ